MFADIKWVNAFAHRVKAEPCCARVVALDGANAEDLHVDFYVVDADHPSMRVGEKFFRLEMKAGVVALRVGTPKAEAVVAPPKANSNSSSDRIGRPVLPAVTSRNMSFGAPLPIVPNSCPRSGPADSGMLPDKCLIN